MDPATPRQPEGAAWPPVTFVPEPDGVVGVVVGGGCAGRSWAVDRLIGVGLGGRDATRFGRRFDVRRVST